MKRVFGDICSMAYMPSYNRTAPFIWSLAMCAGIKHAYTNMNKLNVFFRVNNCLCCRVTKHLLLNKLKNIFLEASQ